ncbi:uncharacterized protein LOC110688134 [Chenopodium quinoa]|uniref:Uncharacterized protein n=1 Tax=Chenopodium quinoa TaxID=63459 RepID=A0A803KR62_CHEQI|nr:uncharacterized protein LOC110688134 [Chenopodium quinoa]XP_021720516.1 uncharacterized protein LOC110688134 [Chenopodium quinoa]XP_021720517.1 uncharacterized protein LOC110688134 [Chenopodium quinoa]XP_021720519.1 uncharacterized protein LOC110688134 [Chenopodium quinoa]XP_021720520.1 uncharacterized protein LOC110688134 [Chenopodium quinoa]
MADHPAAASNTEDTHPKKEVKSLDFFEKTKEEIEALFHHKSPASPRHRKETHGTSGDIDESTPVDEIKAPNVFERVKEEVEAIVGAILPKKDSKDDK